MKLFWLITLLVLPALLCTFSDGNRLMATATDAAGVEDDLDLDDAADVADDGEPSTLTEDYSPDSSDDDDLDSTTSPDANTFLLFTRPLYTAGATFELPAGKPVDFLIGFANAGEQSFVVESVEASFRYPMDFNYYIQNFSAIPFNREVPAGQEATVAYSFIPADSFAGRPFGLNIALNYRDAAGAQFVEAVFNETVNIVELDEGLDGETFFLYVFLAAIAVLLLVVGQQFLAGSVGKRTRRAQVQRKVVETGTASATDVDYDWLPQETLLTLQKSSPRSKTPKQSPNGKVSATSSPRQRKQ